MSSPMSPGKHLQREAVIRSTLALPPQPLAAFLVLTGPRLALTPDRGCTGQRVLRVNNPFGLRAPESLHRTADLLQHKTGRTT